MSPTRHAVAPGPYDVTSHTKDGPDSPLRIGVVARAEDRGLGNLTWETYLHMGDRALVIDPGRYGQGFPLHLDRYGGQILVRWEDDQTLHEQICRSWLEGLDVVYCAETLYDPRFADWAHDAGAAVILHVMPELIRAGELPLVDTVWLPTPWRADEVKALTDNVRLVPVPTAIDRFPYPVGLYESPPLRILHVAGHGAYGDRNGTKLVAAAGEWLDPHLVEVTVVSQDEHVALGVGARRKDPAVNYWDLYDGFHVLAMPRRFGGLCLPIQEAAAAGLAVVTLDEPPAEFYGTVAVPTLPGSYLPSATGNIPIVSADPHIFAATLSLLARKPELVRWEQTKQRAHAESHSWAALGPLWQDELQKASWSRHLDS